MYDVVPVLLVERPLLLELWEASVNATHSFLHSSDIDYYKKRTAYEYFDAVSLYCVRIDGYIAGFAGIKGNMLEMLFVHPKYMRRGVGAALVNYTLNMREAPFVDVNEENKGALAFYKKMGYRVIGRQEVDSANKNYPILHMWYRLRA